MAILRHLKEFCPCFVLFSLSPIISVPIFSFCKLLKFFHLVSLHFPFFGVGRVVPLREYNDISLVEEKSDSKSIKRYLKRSFHHDSKVEFLTGIFSFCYEYRITNPTFFTCLLRDQIIGYHLTGHTFSFFGSAKETSNSSYYTTVNGRTKFPQEIIKYPRVYHFDTSFQASFKMALPSPSGEYLSF